jgi:translation initiation factor 1 (eIF-1/SUI1)
MDILNALNNTGSGSQVLSELDKKIRIKHHKVKNKNKTCVYGIFDFISEKDAELLIKSIKKNLGCSGSISQESISYDKSKKPTGELQKILIFSGIHVEEIRNILLEKGITDNLHIKV